MQHKAVFDLEPSDFHVWIAEHMRKVPARQYHATLARLYVRYLKRMLDRGVCNG